MILNNVRKITKMDNVDEDTEGFMIVNMECGMSKVL